jgi:predicted Zn-dependent protease
MSSRSSTRSTIKGLAWLVAAGLIAFLMANGFPLLARITPWSWEEQLSSGMRIFFPRNQICESHSQETQQALARLIGKIFPLSPKESSLPITIQMIRGETVNAFATLGGHIYVYDGLLKKTQTPEELAGILAHEIGHVTERHILESVLTRLTMAQLITGNEGLYDLMNLSYSRTQESRADELALDRLRKAKISSTGLLAFFERESAQNMIPSILSDHPSGADRARKIRSAVGYETETVIDTDSWNKIRSVCQDT